MAAGWSADETRALLGIWGDADVQSKPHNSSGPLPLSPLPRAFPSPSTISVHLGHEQIEQQEYHERSLASIAFRAREMPGPTNTLSCAYHVRIIYVEVNASTPCRRDLSGSDPASSDAHSRHTPMRI